MLFLLCFTITSAYYLPLFVNQSTSSSQMNLWYYFIIFNGFFKQDVHRGNEISKEHQQKALPYRETLSQGQSPISTISISTSTNSNIVFPYK